MSGVWALIPVKALALGKSRLASRLSTAEREELSVAMLRDVLSAIGEAASIEGGLVIHSDPRVADVASEMSIDSVVESESSDDLNTALTQGLELLAARGAEAVLILPADLPLADAASIEKLVATANIGPSVAICPSLDGDGTNALLLRPPDCILPSFGPGSYERHIAQARDRSCRTWVVRSEQLALDIDEPQHLDQLLDLSAPTRAREVLRSIVSR
jgi:2-phospho-L-lactate/phosphoenolpyruvate guanylyltransferase